MPVFVLLTLRNLLRSPRRMALMATGAAFGIVGPVFILRLFDGFFDQTTESSTRYLMGHIQVERKDFRKDRTPELVINDAVSLLQAVRGALSVITAVPRIRIQALASTASKSEGVTLTGIGPVVEAKATFISRTVVQGRALIPDTDRGVMIGRKLADKLGIRLGKKAVTMAQAASDELGTVVYEVGDIFSTESTSFDSVFTFVTPPATQSLPALGSRVPTINIRLEDRAYTSAAAALLCTRIGGTDMILIPWQELLPQLEDMVQLLHAVNSITLVVLLLMITTSVINTVFMAVAKHTRGSGMMLILDASPIALRRMVVYGSIVLLLIASAVGYGTGIALVLYLEYTGIDLSGLFAGRSAISGLTGIIYPCIFGATVIPPSIVLLIAGVLVSLYPTAKTARLDPVQTIRHV